MLASSHRYKGLGSRQYSAGSTSLPGSWDRCGTSRCLVSPTTSLPKYTSCVVASSPPRKDTEGCKVSISLWVSHNRKRSLEYERKADHSTVNLPGTFNSLFVFTAYAIVALVQGGNGLSVSQAITSLAALNLLAAPLGNLLYAIPQGWAALGCFGRIQGFLLEASRTEQRILPSTSTDTCSDSGEEGFELDSVRKLSQNKIIVTGGSFGWSDSSSHLVSEVNTAIHPGSELTILVGPVGCGKSTLLKGLLGETSILGGQVEVSSSEIAYCDQTPWVTNGSVRDNITAKSEFDAVWYATVCQACGLSVDLRQLPDGDSTVVGSKGVKLSGGQKQRIVS